MALVFSIRYLNPVEQILSLWQSPDFKQLKKTNKKQFLHFCIKCNDLCCSALSCTSTLHHVCIKEQPNCI